MLFGQSVSARFFVCLKGKRASNIKKADELLQEGGIHRKEALFQNGEFRKASARKLLEQPDVKGPELAQPSIDRGFLGLLCLDRKKLE